MVTVVGSVGDGLGVEGVVSCGGCSVVTTLSSKKFGGRWPYIPVLRQVDSVRQKTTMTCYDIRAAVEGRLA